ncbi:MAG: hypothetical protein WA974_18225, partial [Thermodesulfobacteriota bacterium]
CSIKDLLSRDLGITAEYMESRIQTVFLNGKAVDDLDSAILHDGSTLALSGALPGLVGATLRRKGTYASLRRAITLSEEKGPVPQKQGRVVVKLFNLLVPELGPHLLAQGVWISGKDLDQFLKEQDERFWSGLRGAEVDGRPVDGTSLRKIDWSQSKDFILLKLKPISPE